MSKTARVEVTANDQGMGGWFCTNCQYGESMTHWPKQCPKCRRELVWDGTFGGDYGGSDF